MPTAIPLPRALVRAGALAAGVGLLCGAALAQRGDRAAATWPGEAQSVALAFASVSDGVVAYDRRGGEPIFNYRLERSGFARFDRVGALLLERGRATAPGQEQTLLDSLRGGAAFAVQVLARLPERPQPASIVAFGPANAPNFELVQGPEALTFRVLEEAGTHTELDVPLGQLSTRREGAAHLVFACGPEALVAYVDGHPMGERVRPPGARDAWRAGPLSFGDGSEDAPGWTGSLEAFALHTAQLSPTQVVASGTAYSELARRRRPVERTRLTAKLVAKSRVSTPEEIAPYRESLCVFEYEVVRVLEGFFLPTKMRVAHWVVLGGASTPAGSLELGTTVNLQVERFVDNKQLETVNLSDTLDLDFDAELYFEVGSDTLGRQG